MNIMPLPWEIFKLFPFLPKTIPVPPPILAQSVPDLVPMADALVFLGICSVICAGLYATAIIWSSNNKLKSQRKEKSCQ